LPPLYGPPQVILQGKFFHGPLVHVEGVEVVAGPSIALRVVHGGIRVLEQRIGGAAIGGAEADADTDSHENLVSRHVDRHGDGILDAISMPVDVAGHEIFVTVSIGISLSPADGGTADTLLKNADTAMYHSKGNGRAGYHFYSLYMNERSMKKLSLENDLRRAVERGEFELHYQPKLDA